APSLPVTVTALSPPVAGFTYSNVNNTYTFNNTSSDGTSWLWKFGNGDSSNQERPVYTYALSTTYTVTLFVYNDCGYDSVQQAVNVITGTGELKFENHFIIAPDPCSYCELIGKADAKDIEVRDITGRS